MNSEVNLDSVSGDKLDIVSNDQENIVASSTAKCEADICLPNTNVALHSLEDKVGYHFNDLSLLCKSLTHKSSSSYDNYQRLEFLGDAVLDLLIAKYLYSSYDACEGEMTRRRSTFVCGVNLAQISRTLELNEYIRLGEHEMRSGACQSDSILEDVFEALVGAIFVDSNYDFSKVEEFVLPLFKQMPVVPSKHINPAKNIVQEILQANGYDPPSYELIFCEGKPPCQIFSVACVIQSLNLRTRSQGRNRKEAEVASATEMILKLKEICNDRNDRILSVWPKHLKQI